MRRGAEYSEKERIDYDWYKHLVCGYLEKRGWKVNVNPDIYSIDLMAERNGEQMLVEVECKNYDWTCQEDFPFKSVHFVSRKQKYANRPFYYFIVSKNQVGALYQTGDVIYKSRIVTVGGERFYNIPKKDVMFFRLK
jgi:hypothetical protein